ncbi:MAG TPA: hypothetical protein VKV74_08390 [Bryobacteraceae bacterium]|nr:hypothetical protein [Bryobacteraceae bacterium]
MIGFETIGNATIIGYDDEPVIATDAWIAGDAYFGSWGMSHEIPTEQYENIRRAKYQWFSHAHPDHLNVGALASLGQSRFLLAKHEGSRIYNDLTEMGYNVTVLPEREWVTLSPHIRAMTLSDYNQDSILLLDINGRLVLNLNDASDHGWGHFVRKVAKSFRREVYLLNLVTWGDADMMNLFTEDGRRIPPKGALKLPIAPRVQTLAIRYGANRIIPFSSFHRYQREDSVWANEFVPSQEDYNRGADPAKPEILPPFLRVDCVTGETAPLNPRPLPIQSLKAEQFGDNWGDRLEPEEKRQIREYIQKKEELRKHFGFVRFRVGGEEMVVDINPRRHRDRGFTFEAPRNSLCTAVKYEIFDDLLIGNFMKTTLHGGATLYPNFTPVVAKYADNGRAQTSAELREYKRAYYERDRASLILGRLEENSLKFVRMILPERSAAFKAAKRLYWDWKRR